MKFVSVTLSILLTFVAVSEAQYDPHWTKNRTGIVHLFEWKWSDIADECERFLAPNGYAGVQISPPNEYIASSTDVPWWERYQPVSYILQTRSGSRLELADMIKRCNAVGVRIYADAVINHMTGMSGLGSAGSKADYDKRSWPAVPYTDKDFNPGCGIENYSDAYQVRNCWLVGLADLNQTVEWVREKISEYMNDLIDLGVSGFRIDAAKHMWPEDLENIFNQLNNLNTNQGFSSDARPFIYQEVIDLGTEGIKSSEYTHLGTVTEFKFSAAIGKAFRGGTPLKDLVNFGTEWDFLPSNVAFVFVDNHDNQRGHGAGGADILTFKQPKLYKMATGFHLAHPYGIPNLMSSYEFSTSDQGPPHFSNGTVMSPYINYDGSCGNGWICEHRWRQIYGMIEFKNIVGDSNVNHWWDNGNNQIAFGRGNRGFVVFNGETNSDLDVSFQTSLPAGFYCDVVSGRRNGYKCTGNVINVECNGVARIKISSNATDGFVAIHVGQKL